MNRSTGRNVVFFCAVLILLIVFIFSGLLVMESAFFTEEEAPAQSKTIVRDGIEYFPRQDITTIMLLGIGEWGEAVPSERNNATAVDMINVLIFDETQKTATILSLNRDTMVTMPKLNMDGFPQGEAFRQLTYSHKFGTGMEDSCENVRETVSNFLGGSVIDYYISMRLDAIAIMNDAVGGVTVTVTDDFSDVDPLIQEGTHTLTGEQAVKFVQSRRAVGDGSNVARMDRQEEFLKGFLPALRRKADESDTFVLKTYEKVSPYLVTNISVNSFSSMIQRYLDYDVVEYVTPEGENKVTDVYNEFHHDPQKLDDLIVRMFYAPKN